MITKFDINMFEIQSNIRICSGMDYHFDICHVFEISKFDIARFTCIYIYIYVIFVSRILYRRTVGKTAI